MKHSPDDILLKLDKVLLRTEKPGRYVGGEYNQIVKNWDDLITKTCLVFPDLYDLGISNLGISILYESINQRSDALAERAYSPWLDMETLMRQDEIPLYALESKHALIDFDIIGITLPYETLYTNALNILDLAGIPLYTSQRTQDMPLIIAGGHACYNPEPMAAFIDAFVIGEGEEIIHDIINVYQLWKQSGSERDVLLKQLATIWGVYVPSLYQTEYAPDGTILSFKPLDPNAKPVIQKRIVAQLPPSPSHLLVPNIDVVHNRVSVEIMRGCTRGCRFCHAGMINRPIRERKVDDIMASIEQALDNTGFEEIALLSLSSSDYTHIHELIEKLTQKFEGKNLKISLPSLRIESFSIDLMEQLRDARSGGFTLAPEAATERMRNTINKPISSQQLIDTTREIYSRGWLTIKLYFMIGQPTETMEDIQAIADLCKQVLYEGRKVKGKKINLHVGIGTFVPKSHTPFQWASVNTLEEIQTKLNFLRSELRIPGIKPTWTDPRTTLLEGLLSRADRRMGDVIYKAWSKGAKFDAWQDRFDDQLWKDSLADCQLDPAFYVHRPKALDEILPWDHINAGVKKDFLLKDYQWSLEQKLRPDCREQCYACGISTQYADLRSKTQAEWKCP
jgi:radical SAM family uncharacterized protein